ncbi:phosphotransferase family protein [Sphaerisporangium aureirubrum]|uniref:Phosphotransferase family protein n=1 Tax=Sphaerisporangium aureirubrum TaxID=1544736 RepID=A0ABW1NC15_9ACTN
MVHTKRRLRPEQVAELITGALGRPVTSQRELKDGSYAALWRARMRDGDDVVLKLAPPPEVELLTYERDIIRTEALFYELAAATGVPMPTLLHADLDGAAPFLIMTAVDGVPWYRVRESLKDAARRELRAELGRHVAALHAITGTTYGYPQSPGLAGPTWRAAFLAMVDAILADGTRHRADLPMPVPEIAAVVRAHAGALDEAGTPVLVHFDLWPGNVLLDLDGDRPRIAGLVDHERAFWGDPLADFVSLDVFGTSETDEDLVGGYREAGGPAAFTRGARARLALYRIYLYLIMLVEVGPRGFEGEAVREQHEYTGRMLLKQFDVLKAGARQP